MTALTDNTGDPIGVGDLVEFAEDGGVLGRVTAVLRGTLVTVKFPNGIIDVQASTLAVVSRARS